jgi:glycerol-3-phosphate O-acyltransferase/dihydroxyacetone phosphate acyltransferase
MAPSKKTGRKALAPMNNFVYDLFLWTFSIIVDLFFREVHPRSSWKVPRKGPVIFVAAPHANQVAIRDLWIHCALFIDNSAVC